MYLAETSIYTLQCKHSCATCPGQKIVSLVFLSHNWSTFRTTKGLWEDNNTNKINNNTNDDNNNNNNNNNKGKLHKKGCCSHYSKTVLNKNLLSSPSSCRSVAWMTGVCTCAPHSSRQSLSLCVSLCLSDMTWHDVMRAVTHACVQASGGDQAAKSRSSIDARQSGNAMHQYPNASKRVEMLGMWW